MSTIEEWQRKIGTLPEGFYFEIEDNFLNFYYTGNNFLSLAVPSRSTVVKANTVWIGMVRESAEESEVIERSLAIIENAKVKLRE